MSDLKRDLPKDAFTLDERPKFNIENEVMRELDQIELKQVKPLGFKPQLMGLIMAIFFFLLALIGVIADFSVESTSWNMNGMEIQKLFGKIPVQLHFAILILSAGFMIYMIYRSLKDVYKSTLRS